MLTENSQNSLSDLPESPGFLRAVSTDFLLK
eukprot:COSAG01_NODE_67830_length_266_cov_0.305389_1_plen_30_part_01